MKNLVAVLMNAMLALVLLLGWSGSAHAGSEVCAENGGNHVCIKSTLSFSLYDRPGQYSSGSAACSVYNHSAPGTTFTGGTWIPNDPQ